MSLITLQNICHNFVGIPILSQANLTIENKQKICLVGRNGEGKSTFLSILTKQLVPDKGTVAYNSGITVSSLPQEVPTHFKGSSYSIACSFLGAVGDALIKYHKALDALTLDGSDSKALDDMADAQTIIDELDGWQKHQKLTEIFSKLSLDPDVLFETLSGGGMRRVLLAGTLASDPDVLILDEPTNHLDIDSILWLEKFLLKFTKTILFVSHDRTFTENIADHIIELDRGNLRFFKDSYFKYLEKKDALALEEERHNSLFDKKLAQEEVWIRQGVKARRTRNMGRVRALKDLRSERKERRDQQGKVNFVVQDAHLSGKLVVEAKNVDFSYENKQILSDFSVNIMRGDHIGIIGPNGSGKTTLINVLLQKVSPDAGVIKLGTNIEVLYSDQLRQTLDYNKTAKENIAAGSDWVEVNGHRKHVISYLKDFLFTKERMDTPAKHLSGGEKNRLLLAQLFTRPGNLLILDEPTNDLDLDTLELLEEILLDYKGTLLLVSHDRRFINNIVTSVLAFDYDGVLREYVGDYDDWKAASPKPLDKKDEKANKIEKSKSEKSVSETTVAENTLENLQDNKNTKGAEKKKTNFKDQWEQKELLKEQETLPSAIDAAEKEQAALLEFMSEQDFYKNTQEIIQETQNKLDMAKNTLEKLYERWEIVESRLAEFA